MHLLFTYPHPNPNPKTASSIITTRLEEFLPTIPEKDWAKAWEAIAVRIPPLVELVTAAAAGGLFCPCVALA